MPQRKPRAGREEAVDPTMGTEKTAESRGLEDRILVASLGLEGGGADIYGRQTGGVWTFWLGGSTIDFDENDDETWRWWTSPPVQSLDLAVPKDWPLFSPIAIHPDFVPWFRAAYEEARQALPEHMRPFHDRNLHPEWLRYLGEPQGPTTP
jgi:hypothetical protein